MNDFRRYARQMVLPEIGKEGQKQLSSARVFCVGAGGLGCPALLYLAGAGVGNIGIIDDDTVDESNLQRQTLYSVDDIGQPKVMAAQKRLNAYNPGITVTPYAARLTAETAIEIIPQYDIIIDGSDNFATRFLVNDACVLYKKPLVYGSVQKFEGQAAVFEAAQGPCYRCLFPELPGPGMGPNCAEAGVLGVVPGLVGMIQATEAIKLVLKTGDTLRGRLLVLNALSMTFHELIITKDRDCPCCGNTVKSAPLQNYDIGGCKMGDISITPTELQKLMQNGTPFTLIDVRGADEYDICHIPGSRLIPLDTLASCLDKLPPNNQLIVLHCHHGGRSMQALRFLQTQGFAHLKNLAGGIEAWAMECDPKMTRY